MGELLTLHLKLEHLLDLLSCLRTNSVKSIFYFQSFSEDVFQSIKSLLQSEKELCSVSAEDCLKQDEHASLTEV